MVASPGQQADGVISMVIEAGLAGTSQIEEEAKQVLKRTEKFFNGLNNVVNTAFVGTAAAAAAVGAAALAGVGSLIQFEDAFAGVRKTVDADEETLQRLGQAIRDLATELPVAATELARIGELGGQLGIEAENIEAFTEVVTKLSVATVLSTENAALALARLGAIASIPESQLDDFFRRTGASIVELGNNFAATEDEIITTVLRIATAAEQSGASTQDALAFATALQAIGVPAQAGGTAIARVFQEIQRAIQNGGEQLSLFAEISGQSSEQFQKNFQDDAANAVVTFIEGLATAEDRINGVQNVLQKLNLSQRRTQLAVNGLATAQGLLRDALVTSRAAYEANVALNVEAAKKFATTKQQLILLKNQFKEATMQLGEELLPALRNIIFQVQAFTKGVIETNFGLTHFIDLFKQLFVVLAGGKVIAAIGQVIVLLQRLKVTQDALTMSSVVLTAVTGNLGKIFAGLAAIVPITMFINKMRKEFDAIAQSGGAVAFADVLKDVEEFGAGANDTLRNMKTTLGILKNDFQQLAGVDFSLIDQEDIDADSIKDALSGAGIEVDDGEISKILNAALYIQTMNTNIQNLENSLTFVFDQAVENIKGAGGAVGEFFTKLDGLRSKFPEIETFFKDVFMEGQDPSKAIEKTLDVLTEQEKTLLAQKDALVEKVNMQQEDFELQEELNQKLTEIKSLRLDILEITEKDGLLYDGIAMFEEERLNNLSEQILLHQGKTNLLDTEIKSLAKAITKEREDTRLKYEQLGISKSIIDNMELSTTVQEYQNQLRQQGLDLAKDELASQYNIIMEQMVIAQNIEAIAKESARSIVSLFNNVPDQIKISASEMTRNLQDQAIVTAEFMATIQALQARGFQMLAANLAKAGPAAMMAAKDFLKAPELAAEAESNLRVMQEDVMKQLAGVADEIDISGEELRDKFEPYGGDIVDGLSKGIRENSDEIKQAIIDAVENGEKGLILEFGIKSPARRFIPYGEAFADALAVGMQKNGGKFSVAVLEAAKKAAEDLSTFTLMEQNELMEWANSQIAEISKGMANSLNMDSLFSSEAYKAGLASFKDGLVETFDLFTGFTQTFARYESSQQKITEAQREYNDVVQEGIDNLQKQTDLTAELTALQTKFGAAGVITSFEQLQIDKASLRLLQMKTNLNKTDTASERLAIKDARREVDFLEQAVKRGVATEDELQAAKERLADLTGTTEGIDNFKDRADYQAILDLQKKIANAEIQNQQDLVTQMGTDALLVDPSIVAMQERIAELEQTISDQSNAELVAQQGISDAKLDQFNLQLKLFQLSDKIVSLGPEGVEQFRAIATAAGMPLDQVNNIIEKSTELSGTYKSQFDEVAKGFFDTKFIMEEAAKLKIDTDEAERKISRIKQHVNDIYRSFDMEIPFPDLEAAKPPAAAPQGSTYNPIDKMLHKGGFLGLGKRALVGEFGPEIISPSPSGVRVTPTGIGAAGGGGIIVNNLHVNVNGVPSRPQDARKAAIEIEKALVNLRKEGRSSGILGY